MGGRSAMESAVSSLMSSSNTAQPELQGGDFAGSVMMVQGISDTVETLCTTTALLFS